MVKIANFSRVHCLAIPRRELSTKETKPNKAKINISLEGTLECKYIERGQLSRSAVDPGYGK